LSDKDIDEFVGKVKGAVVYDTHDVRKAVGQVIQSYKDPDTGLMGIIVINDVEVIKKIRNGTYKGLSLGNQYKVDFSKHKVVSKDCNEVSVCKEGDIPGTFIYAHFDKESGGLSKPFGIEWQEVDVVTSIASPPSTSTTPPLPETKIAESESGFLKVTETGDFPAVEAFIPHWKSQPRELNGKWTIPSGKKKKVFFFSFSFSSLGESIL
jgi:hypothetical protein